MSENSTSDVGRATIDAYLDAVEQALLAAHAPRCDRGQVVQDLESQIADMLVQQPEPLTETMVCAVIEKLEPPSHFAAMYGNGKQPRVANAAAKGSAWPSPWTVLMALPWTRVAAVSLAVMVTCALMVTFYVLARRVPSNPDVLLLSLSGAFVATTCAMALSYKQLRARPTRFPDRDLWLKCAVGYAVSVPLFLMFLLTYGTDGAAIVPFGILGFLYLLYAFAQWLRRYLAAALPEATCTSTGDAENHRGANGPMGSAARAV